MLNIFVVVVLTVDELVVVVVVVVVVFVFVVALGAGNGGGGATGLLFLFNKLLDVDNKCVYDIEGIILCGDKKNNILPLNVNDFDTRRKEGKLRLWT